ncbi:MAG: signal peptidase II [Puniceicoccales bacterium]|jgi:signal peptidase II|nr:signal peptidase II [Puniceicoccales bacterium]
MPAKPEPSAPPPARPNLALVYLRHRLARYRRFWIFFTATVLLDQASKLAVLAWLPPSYDRTGFLNPPFEVIPDFFNLVHVYNTGAAFSMLSGQSVFLFAFAIAALVIIFRYRRSFELERKSVQLAFGLLTGGIAGNAIDRLLYGHVVDFIDVNPPGYGFLVKTFLGWSEHSRWPAFNIADSAICIGVILYVVLNILFPTKNNALSAAPDTPE